MNLFNELHPYILTIITSLLVYQLQVFMKVVAEERRNINNIRNKRDAAFCRLLRIKLTEYYNTYINEGEIPTQVFENYLLIYQCYHALGGNGMIDRMHEEIKKLKLKG